MLEMDKFEDHRRLYGQQVQRTSRPKTLWIDEPGRSGPSATRQEFKSDFGKGSCRAATGAGLDSIGWKRRVVIVQS